MRDYAFITLAVFAICAGCSTASRRPIDLVDPFIGTGFHGIKVLWFDDYMRQKLEVSVVARDIPETLIPDNMLFYSK